MNKELSLEKALGMTPQEKKDLVERIAQDACDFEKKCRGCCQVVVAAIQNNLKIGSIELYKAASAMGAGVAGNGEICGALLAGILCIGVIYGRDSKEKLTTYSEKYQDARDRAGSLSDKYRAEFGSLRCCDVLEKLHGRLFNLRKSEDREAFSVPEIHDKCAFITCKKAAQMAAEVLLEVGGPNDY